MSTDFDRNITVSASVADEIERRLGQTDFDKVGEYATFVLEEILASLDKEDGESEVSEAEVKERLQSLGYID